MSVENQLKAISYLKELESLSSRYGMVQEHAVLVIDFMNHNLPEDEFQKVVDIAFKNGMFIQDDQREMLKSLGFTDES